MSRYHVYLPPTTLTPLETGSIHRLEFSKLDPLHSTLSQNTFSQSIREVTAGLPPHRVVEGSDIKRDAEDPEKEGEGSRSKAMGVKRSRGPLRKTQTEVTVSDTSRRRSSRLGGRTSGTYVSLACITAIYTAGVSDFFATDGLIGTLPGSEVENTESFISLNTTMSNPSQPFPPTADQSSLLNFPNWSIPLTKLTTLASLLARPFPRSRRGNDGDGDQLISIIVCVLSVDQPVQRQRKEEKARGEEGSLWIGNWAVTAPAPVLGEEAGSCQVRLWDSMARDWGDERVRKGDIVLLEREASFSYFSRLFLLMR